jgi:ribosomal subunit interface protein
MNITYTGKIETFYPTQQQKLDVRFSKLAKLLDGKGEKASHVILTKKRNIHGAEITVNYLAHSLVGEAKDEDQYMAITSAIEKLEKQVLKVRAKRRGIKTGPRDMWDRESSANAVPEPAVKVAASKVSPSKTAAERAPVNGRPRIYRVDPGANPKPITLDEAVMSLRKPGDYAVYRDADKDCLSVVIMRPDGHFDLVES